MRVSTIPVWLLWIYRFAILWKPYEARAMVQAFDALEGDGVPKQEAENAHTSFIGEVMDWVENNKTVSAVAGLGITAGALYFGRAPIGRLLSRCGGSLFAAEETVGSVLKGSQSPLGRKVVANGIKATEELAGALKTDASAVAATTGEEAIVSGAKLVEEGTATQRTRPLLTALDDAVKSGKAKTAPEPWAYNAEHRGMLKDLPNGGSDLRAAGESVESMETVTSTRKVAFPELGKPAEIDANKHKFLTGKRWYGF